MDSPIKEFLQKYVTGIRQSFEHESCLFSYQQSTVKNVR